MFERIDKEADGTVYVKEVTDFLRVLDDNMEQVEKVKIVQQIKNFNQIYTLGKPTIPTT